MSVVVSQAAEPLRLAWNLSRHVLSDLILSKDDLIKMDLTQNFEGTENPSDKHKTQKPYITSIDYECDGMDSYCLLVGSSSGQVQAMKLHDRLVEKDVIKFNLDGALNGSSCILVAWVPGSRGTEFVSVHRDGMIIKHHKIIGNSSDNALLHRSESQSSIRESSVRTVAVVQGGAVTCSALSPDGSMVATATDNGMMTIIGIPSGEIAAVFPSFFGSFTCCSWSTDGAYLAAGGEDDLIAVYRIASRSIVAHCKGHTSWVSSVAIQPRQGKDSGALNMVSVGQDLSMCTWEIPGIDAIEGKLDNSSTCYRDMNLVAPTSRAKIHKEPLSHVKFVDENHVVVSGYDGTIKYFARTIAVD